MKKISMICSLSSLMIASFFPFHLHVSTSIKSDLTNYENVNDFEVEIPVTQTIACRYNNPKEDISVITVYDSVEKKINVYTKSIKYMTGWKLSTSLTPTYPIFNVSVEFAQLGNKQYVCVFNQEIFIMNWNQNNWTLSYFESSENHLFLPAEIANKPQDILVKGITNNSLETANGLIISTSGLDVNDPTGKIYNWRVWGLTLTRQLTALYTQDTSSVHQYLISENIFSFYDTENKFHILQTTWNLDATPRNTSTLKSIEINEDLTTQANVITLFDAALGFNQWVRFMLDEEDHLIIIMNRTNNALGCCWYANKELIKSNLPINFDPRNPNGNFKRLPFSDNVLNNVYLNDAYLNPGNKHLYINLTLSGRRSIFEMSKGALSTSEDIEILSSDVIDTTIIPFSAYGGLRLMSSYNGNDSISYISNKWNSSAYIDDKNNRPIPLPKTSAGFNNQTWVYIGIAMGVGSFLIGGTTFYLIKKKKRKS